MRKVVEFLLVACLLVVPATAQRGRGGMGGGFHGGMGGGFRGGGFYGGGFHGGGFGGPGFRGGFVNRGFGGFRGGFYRNRFFYGYGAPYWPYYGAGWFYPPYAYDPYYAYSSPYAYPYSYSYPGNYGYAYGNSDVASCPQANGTPLYLIKLTYQDKVWMAQNYWYTPGTLNFTTLQGEQNKTPIDSIDRALTFQLNNACGLDFQLPGH